MLNFLRRFGNLNFINKNFDYKILTINKIYSFPKFGFSLTEEEREKMKKSYTDYRASRKHKKKPGKSVKIAHRKEIVQQEEISQET